MGPAGRNMHLKFNGSCLKTTEKYCFYSEVTELNICIVYKLSSNLNNFNFALENCLFGAVRLTINADTDKYKLLGYGIGFDSRRTFLFPDGSFPQNVIVFGADMSSSVHANNKTKNILVLGKGVPQKLDNTTIYAEKLHLINFSKSNALFYLSLHYNTENCYLFVNGTEIHKFKARA